MWLELPVLRTEGALKEVDSHDDTQVGRGGVWVRGGAGQRVTSAVTVTPSHPLCITKREGS